jgi:hypothetical protein
MAKAKPQIAVQRPPDRLPDDDAWVAGGAVAQKRKAVKPEKRPNALVKVPAADVGDALSSTAARREFSRQRDGAQLRRLHVRIPAELERALAVYCAQSDRSAGEVVTVALVSFLKSA